jgi:hypothetical protein
MRTPWGESDHTIKLARGVVWVNTPSHGGFLFTHAAAEKLLTEQARNAAEPWRNGFAFEEDCKAAIVIYEHPEYDEKLRPGPDWDGKTWAYGVISRWDADYLLARGIVPNAEGYACFLQDREEERLRAEHSPDLIVSASGDWAEWVPKGRVGVITADDKRYTVPVAEYDALQESSGLTLLSRLHDVKPVAVTPIADVA